MGNVIILKFICASICRYIRKCGQPGKDDPIVAGHAGCCQFSDAVNIAGRDKPQARIELKIPSKQMRPGMVGLSFLAATLAGIVSASEIWLSPTNSLSSINTLSYSGTGTRTNPYY